MKVSLICEKPSMASAVIKKLLNLYPNIDRASFSVLYVNFYTHLNNAFSFPKGHKFSDYPLVKEVEYKPFIYPINYLPPRLGIGGDDLGGLWIKWNSCIDTNGFVEQVVSADRVYLITDTSPSSQYVALRTVQWLKTLSNSMDLRLVELWSFSEQDIKTAILNEASISDLETKASRSIVRRHFDYNYLLNSFPLIDATARKAIGRSLRGVPSKNALQILYFMRDGKRLSEPSLTASMANWKGTGRYSANPDDWYFNGMGSESTRSGIVEYLLKDELLVECDRREVSISRGGLSFLDHLHPDCEDPDQTYRINEWTFLPVAEAKSKIDRYIKTFFGKQKRFLGRRLN